MPSSYPPLLDTETICELVGTTSYTRGRAYARKGSVSNVTWDGAALKLAGKVQGNRASPYRTAVLFSAVKTGLRPDADLRPSSGSCSCPMGYGCKHVAALLLTSNEGFTRAAPRWTGMEPLFAEPAHTPPRVLAPPPRPAPEPEPLWTKQLDSLLTPVRQPAFTGGYRAGRPAPEVPTPLGVQFELREVANQQFGHQRRRNALMPDGQDDKKVLLTVRPVKRNAKGKWLVGNLRWDAFRDAGYGYGYGTTSISDCNQVHVQWMRTFVAVHNSGTAHAARDAWLYLDHFNSPLFWGLLAQGAAAGVEFVGTKAGSVVVIHDPVSVSLDVRAEDDALQLLPHAEAGGEPLNPSALGLIGQQGHGLFWWDPDKAPAGPEQSTIHLAPAADPIGDVLRPLIETRTPLQIPGAGRDAFLENYFPKLHRNLRIVSSNGSVEFPQLVPPLLVLRAAYIPEAVPAPRRGRKPQAATGPGVLTLDWHWEYTVGADVQRRPLLDAGSGPGDRDDAFESALLRRVAERLSVFSPAWLQQLPDAVTGLAATSGGLTLSGLDAARFSAAALPELAGLEHVRVDIVGEAPDYAELTEAPRIDISTKGTDDGDWFDLGVTVTLGETDVPFDTLFRALAAGEEHLMLANGNYFALDQPQFVQLRKLIEEARSLQEKDSGLQISRYQAGLWDELEELAATAVQAGSWRSCVSGLLQLGEMAPVPVPAGISASLRPYQQQGFSWLAFLFDHGLGGVLADDMGLGKTLQTIALFCHAKAAAQSSCTGPAQPFLVVAPTSVVPNWAAEIARFAPGLRTVAVSDTLRRAGTDAAALTNGADVVVVSYTLFRLDYEAYAAQGWAGLILDEAQFVKNPATKASQNARRFPAPFKLAITGTPMENNLMELWSMFAITAPGLFPTATNFADYYQKPVEKEGDKLRLAQLRRRIRPLIMRRTKDLVAKELPPKQEQVLQLELAPRHRVIYQRHLQRERQKVLGMLDDMDKNRFAIFRSLTTLRMLSLDASLVDAKYASAPSSKLDALFEQLEDIVAEGHRALIFSQFTSFLGKAAERLDAAGISYAYLDGKTRRRGEVIDRFKSGTAPVFLISLKAGGFGLNLTEADYVFLLDPWWNPATENQAVDRTHRIGQSKNVMVYRLVAKDTIEEKVMALKEKKARLFSAVMDDDAMFSTALSADDVRGLFDS